MSDEMGRSVLEGHAALVLAFAFAMSLVYELWRSTARAGTSRHDSMRVFVTQGMVIYVVAAAVIYMLLAGVAAGAWVGLVFAVVSILVSLFYYNPVVMLERKPHRLGGRPGLYRAALRRRGSTYLRGDGQDSGVNRKQVGWLLITLARSAHRGASCPQVTIAAVGEREGAKPSMSEPRRLPRRCPTPQIARF